MALAELSFMLMLVSVGCNVTWLLVFMSAESAYDHNEQ